MFQQRDSIYWKVGCRQYFRRMLLHLSRPSCAAAPPGMILVMKMLGSSPTWGLSVPPAMLKPRPELPCGSRIVQGHRGAVEGGHRMVDRGIRNADASDSLSPGWSLRTQSPPPSHSPVGQEPRLITTSSPFLSNLHVLSVDPRYRESQRKRTF